ncbi:MAG: hypothetical protein FI725_01830 [SAR202 cluster bacterium]|nr:hypothetical protein [SAR202 cluster bacterium]|tara:strand:+ start:8330 stop:9109 length:780 start_codon:yes stop_codon:yes gene_type:complete
MSQFVNKLKNISEGGGQPPMGFGRALEDSELKVLPLVHLANVTAKALKEAVDAGGTFFILPGNDVIGSKKLPAGLKKVTWGAFLDAATDEKVAVLKEKGCDFFIFPLSGTSVSILRDEDLGKVLIIDSDIDDRTVRAVGTLVVDAVLAKVDVQAEVTLENLLTYTFIGSLAGDYFLVDLPHTWTDSVLEELYDNGVTGVVVSFNEMDGADDIKRLNEAIKNLPARRRDRQKDRSPVSSLTSQIAENVDIAEDAAPENAL